MIKKIKRFLLTSVALGFLQLETSAMEDDNNNTAAIRHTTVQERRETDDRLHNELTRIRENATGFSKNIEDALSSILNRLQQQSEENALLSRTVMELQQQLNPLIQENATLSRKVNELQEQLNPSNPLRAVFKNKESKPVWTPYTNKQHEWIPMTFDSFDGDDERLKGNLSIIEIPEPGFYSLSAHYCWRAKASTEACTTISINRPENGYLDRNFVKHHLARGFEAMGNLSRHTRLNKGDKVMVSTLGNPNAEYALGRFRLEIEKIH